jgi:hypothetical protein
MATPRTGTLIWQKRGYAARVPVRVEGELVKQVFFLETDSKAVARVKMRQLIERIERGEMPDAETAGRAESFADACARVHELRKKDGVKSATDEDSRLKRYAVPELGAMLVTAVRTLDVNGVLDACKAKGRDRQTVVHLKQDLGNVFSVLKREGAIKVNPVNEAEVPKYGKTVKKTRAVLTDEELVSYLDWQHPLEKHQGAALERQVMACIARMFGGLRTGDLHGLVWASFDLAPYPEDQKGGRFAWGWAPRQKTGMPQKLPIPMMLRPILRVWWEGQGRPSKGPVFPVRRGERAGDTKRKASHAQAFRRDLQRAFGLVVWKQTSTDRNGQPVGVWEPADGRVRTPREVELFEATTYTLPVDFHSWRRAFSQALAHAGVNAQQAMGLAAHASLEVHERYLRTTPKMLTMPEAALPRLDIFDVRSAPPLFSCSSNSVELAVNQSGWQDLNLQQPAPKDGVGGDESPAPILDGGKHAGFAAPERRGPLLSLRSGDRVPVRMSAGDVRCLPVGERAELLALANQLLDVLPNPSHARGLALAMVRLLEAEPAASARDVG